MKTFMIKRMKNIDNLDLFFVLFLIFAAIAIILYTIFIFTHYLIYVIPITFILVCSIIWVIYRKGLSLKGLSNFSCSRQVFMLLNSLFFLFLTLSAFSIHFRPNLYMRPLIYFMYVSVMSGLVAIEILFSPTNRKYLYLILLQIIIIGINVSWSQQLLFSGVVETDAWYHQMLVSKIIQLRHIPVGYQYSKLPVFHLIITFTSLLTGLNYKLAAMFSISLIQITCNTLFVFLLSIFLFKNSKVGLLSSLLLIIADRHIWMSYTIIPNSLGGVFVLIITYLILKLKKEKLIKMLTISILFIVVLILTHTISTMCMVIILFAYLATSNFYNIFHHSTDNKNRTIIFTAIGTLLITMIIATFALWSVSGYLSKLLLFTRHTFSVSILTWSMPRGVANYFNTIPFAERLHNMLGEALFFGISFIGIFFAISKRGNRESFMIALTSMVLFGISFLSNFGFYILQYRWTYFAQIFFALFLAASLFLLIYNFNRNKNTITIVFFIFIFFLTFVMITNNIATLDNNSFSPNSNVRLALTESEAQSITTISEMWNKTVGTDEYYSLVINNMHNTGCINYDAMEISNELFSGNFEKYNRLLLIRGYISQQPVRIFRTNYKLNYNPTHTLTNQHFSKIFNSGSVSGFYYP